MRTTIILVASILPVLVFSQTPNELPANGDVGIGTSTPDCKLDVHGETKLDGTVTVKDSMKVEKDLIVDQNLQVNGEATFTEEVTIKDEAVLKDDVKIDGTLKLSDLATSPGDHGLLLVKHNGNVLRGGSFTEMLAEEIYDLPCRTDEFGQVLPVWSNGEHILFTGVDCPASVGINTNAPQFNLQVVGDGEIIDLDVTGRLKVGASSIWIGGIDAMTGSNNNIFSTDDLYIQSDATNSYNTIINYNNSGNVGIGVDTPGEKLEVAGTVRACKFIAKQSTWCDYVFDDDYELLTINEVAEYIEENHHLPDVPSTEDITLSGNDLAETDAILLRKIEELTLYIIEQQNEIEALRAEIDQMNE